MNRIEVGTIVEGKVVKIKPFGAIVSLPDNSHGLVHISHVSTGFVQNVSDMLNIGDTVNVKVLSIDEATRKISLSIKEALPPSERPERPQQKHDSGHFHSSRADKTPLDPKDAFESILKDWQKEANDRQAGLNKRNKRR